MLRMKKLLTALCLLGICFSLGFSDELKTIKPEDEEASGDDEDFFSGSGFDAALPEETNLHSGYDKDIHLTTVTTLEPIDERQTTESHLDAEIEKVIIKQDAVQTGTTMPSEDPVKSVEDSDSVVERPAIIPTSVEGTTHRPTTHQASTASFTTSKSIGQDVDSGKHHHHPHHHHHHNKTTISPLLSIADTEGTSPSPAHAGESHVHHVHHVETATGPSDHAEPNVHHEFTTPVKADDLVNQHIAGNETTLNPSDAEEFHIAIGSVEPSTKSPSEDIDTNVHNGHHEQTTTKSSEVEDPQLHHEVLATSPSSVDGYVQPIETTTDAESEKGHDHFNHFSTIPIDLDKHHDHYPPHHTVATTPSSTSQSVDSEIKDQLHTTTSENIVPANDSVVPVLIEDDRIPEMVDPVYGVTSSPDRDRSAVTIPEENDDSKEEEGSAVDPNSDIYIEEPAIVNDKAPINRMNANVDSEKEGSLDASHGIMERKEVLGGIIAGGIAGLIFALALVGFMLYRMKKKDEGSYSLEEPKQSNGGYQKPREQREFYA
ncbi:syndecan-1 [Bombina bombina]|uniref:syndecan-1 n=1 Tax=Bombina bombina TaxID=8345 RepID=UPI00235A8034|nr:syndecan-1 [Bombina bombina]